MANVILVQSKFNYYVNITRFEISVKKTCPKQFHFVSWMFVTILNGLWKPFSTKKIEINKTERIKIIDKLKSI